ncbi:hypothetical protein R1flu_008332 [Riccia fluitans]|uniref:Uncharacterized protein n=1 Tax=Riccia fluitans TaxID=41844 RepID=A0ABD1YBG2_9MARC
MDQNRHWLSWFHRALIESRESIFQSLYATRGSCYYEKKRRSERGNVGLLTEVPGLGEGPLLSKVSLTAAPLATEN